MSKDVDSKETGRLLGDIEAQPIPVIVDVEAEVSIARKHGTNIVLVVLLPVKA
jgi:hypothetical protein